MNTFISYDGLPISSGGAHSIGSLSPKEVYGSLVTFLNACTTNPAPEVELLFNPSVTTGSMRMVWQLTKMFGCPKWNMNHVQQEWVWTVKNKKVDAALEALKLSDALGLTFLWKFKFIHPDTKMVLDGQEAIPVLDERLYNSQIYFRTLQKSTVSAWFTLPFHSFSEAANYFAPFTALLPFTPSPKHWRIWKCSKNGNWKPRRIEENAG